MNIRRIHKVIGIILLLPFFGWVITGIIFFVKPGYSGAYETLKIKTYPLSHNTIPTSDSTWLEFRYLKTILGDHLIVRTNDGWKQIDPKTMKERSVPNEDEIKALLKDSFSSNPQRYGNITAVSGDLISTDTDIEITLDWNRLSLYQKGKDTDRIDFFYKIHYLQWTGIQSIDRYLGILGLALVLILSILGSRLALKK